MVKKVFYIEKSDFLRSMMEFALRARGAEIYTVETIENNFYLLDDLMPDIVLFDVETAHLQLDKLYEYSTKMKLVGVGSESDRSLLKSDIKCFLTKPFEAKNLAERILSL